MVFLGSVSGFQADGAIHIFFQVVTREGGMFDGFPAFSAIPAFQRLVVNPIGIIDGYRRFQPGIAVGERVVLILGISIGRIFLSISRFLYGLSRLGLKGVHQILCGAVTCLSAAIDSYREVCRLKGVGRGFHPSEYQLIVLQVVFVPKIGKLRQRKIAV